MRAASSARTGEQPLLHDAYLSSDDDGRGRRAARAGNRRGSPLPPTAHFAADTEPGRPSLSRRSTTQLRSRSPTTARAEARTKYTYAASFLVLSLVSFTVQTELASYIQHELKWSKAYFMLYLTHSSWVFLWPLQVLYQKYLRKRDQSWGYFWKTHIQYIRQTAQMVRRQEIRVPRGMGADISPWSYLAWTTGGVTTALTIAGLSWYIAVSMTTPSDLTAIYNCSAFFAYAFSVPLLKEQKRLDKLLAVIVAIVGVMVVAYGGGTSSSDDSTGPSSRLQGNIIIFFGSVLYGLYEVLYKRYACPPDGISANRSMIFANVFGSLMGGFTLFVLWIPIIILNWLGWEEFEWPTGETFYLLSISIFANMVFSGSFLVLMSLTSPVLSSVAALLTIFIVAVVDWFLTGQPLDASTIIGGLLIVSAFLMLSRSTWKEMNEQQERKTQIDLSDSDGDED
ncbi:hypothetical protein QBC35DRAFT_281293 [Podospora australis]|uniref:EamA domain-containing protein n=1 Tax=Podospora australis TaxID=1536484 RepID=A0AAN6WQB7_9PEZI|nr:hypothetical protein QBC35DRAFT_281293 [Podospora australis]